MAKALILVSALICFLALASSFAHAQDGKSFNVFGMVYCDPCNVEFQTRVSKPLADAKVQLQCRKREDGAVTLTEEAATGQDGTYSLIATGEHEDEICEVTAVSSPDAKCNLAFQNIDKARVLLTENNGVQGTDRYANPLGFKTAAPDAACKDVLAELGMVAA